MQMSLTCRREPAPPTKRPRDDRSVIVFDQLSAFSAAFSPSKKKKKITFRLIDFPNNLFLTPLTPFPPPRPSAVPGKAVPTTRGERTHTCIDRSPAERRFRVEVARR
ncbi:hypothetical protein PUN28_005637 [Cardiocondyla obscurior]|uniref:Uncharacterized protein n=1 Tax=Cardiocondyla obscurior TaxID=286306 RepID=A0AAW2GIU3_9HYME